MQVHQESVLVSTRGKGLTDITPQVRRVVAASRVRTGLCTVFARHTSCSLVIQENADPAVLRDLQRWLERIAPEDARAYEHDTEGLDDMPAHLRAAITKSSESIPIGGGELVLGTWQALYLWEHRRAGNERELVVHVAGLT